jgi:hypothetical protein
VREPGVDVGLGAAGAAGEQVPHRFVARGVR